MKHFLLLLLLLGAAGSAQAQAQAQLVNLISGGIRMGMRDSKGLGTDPRAPTPDINVTKATYRGQSYPQKRTPPSRLNGPGGEQIVNQESLLQKCQLAMTADSTGAIGNAATWATLKQSLEAIARDRPTWNVQAYRDEAVFYQGEDARRQRILPAPH